MKFQNIMKPQLIARENATDYSAASTIGITET